MSNTILAIDIGSTNITAVIAQNDLNNKINILGTGVETSEGINKGLITNIEVASKAIKDAVYGVNKGTASNIDSTYVSISAAYTKGVRSAGSVNVPNGQITQTEINQVLQMALYNATIVPEYDVVHVLPIYFKVDDSQLIDNPLNMNGARLEVAVYIVTAKKTALTNIKSALKSSNLEISNFVLSGYASAISVLDEQQKRFGAAILDIGGSTTDIVCFKGKSIIYNDFLPVGSANITNDLSVTLHTPPNAAETLKIQYANLLNSTSLDKEENNIKKVKIPVIGDEQNTKEMPLDSVQLIIHARVEEILVLAKEKIKKSGVLDSLGAGIVITGGMSQLPGIKELAQEIFENIPVKIANPINIRNGYMSFDDPTMATIVGLLLYGLDSNPNFELDSNKKLRQKKEIRNSQSIPQSNEIKTNNENLADYKKQQDILPRISTKDKAKGVSKFWNKVAEWF
ncbi:MAG: cell division protein FtsA [Candidatus Marinarcus sp.]|uniref:cell division protein FtsA n=1 Tax=Candidatus Marinarcus sp. TaxID=3100987 RepID=UPI003B008577